jgi:putative ABC transport system permease protein
MILTRHIPLALKNLTHNKRRLAISLLGISVAVVLMFMELGFYFGLLDSMVRVVDLMETDLIVTSRARNMLSTPQLFDDQRLLPLRGHPDVATVQPFYMETATRSLRRSGAKSKPIRVLAFDLEAPLLRIPGLSEFVEPLSGEHTCLIDRNTKTRAFSLPELDDKDRLTSTETELADKKIRIVGTFDLGTDFINDGNLIMSSDNFSKYFPYRNGRVDLGLLTLRSGVSVERVRESLRAILPEDVEIFTKREFIDREQDSWTRNTPVGFIFKMGALLGFVVGVIICFQIIFANIADCESEYATMKAIGYANGHLVRLLIAQSIYLSISGFVCGWGLSVLGFELLSWLTGLPMQMTVGRVAFLYAATLVMCLCSGGLALKKVIALDPAELF